MMIRGKSPWLAPKAWLRSALFGFGRHAGGGTGPHHVDDDHRRFDHARHADRLGHQGDAAAGGRAHAPHAHVTGPDGHVDDRNLVLDLADADAQLLGVTGKPFEDVRRGAHRIRAIELAAGECRTHGDQLVARHQRPLLAGFLELLGERLEMGGSVVVAGLCRFHVHLDDLRLLGKRRLEHRLQACEIQPHQANRGPDGHRVLHDRQLFVGGGQLGHRQWAELHAFGGLVPRLELGGVVKRQAASPQLLQMAVQGVLVQRDGDIHLIAVVQRLLGRDAQAQPGMAAANH